MTNEQLQGSQTAKNGFKNEDDIVDKFDKNKLQEDIENIFIESIDNNHQIKLFYKNYFSVELYEREISIIYI